MAETRAMLYSFWLSSCSWRVRAALIHKGVPFQETHIDIVTEQHQNTQQYKAINPMQKVPALVIDGETLVESMAIIQYLEDTRPSPSLTPTDPLLKARMREICEIIVSGIQPLQNIGLRSQFETEEGYVQFTKHFARKGLEVLEDILPKTAGRFCIGDQLTQADLCLVPQLYNSLTRHKLSLDEYPTISKLYEKLIKEKIFEESHPKTRRPEKTSMTLDSNKKAESPL